jgi:hypothetical protein
MIMKPNTNFSDLARSISRKHFVLGHTDAATSSARAKLEERATYTIYSIEQLVTKAMYKHRDDSITTPILERLNTLTDYSISEAFDEVDWDEIVSTQAGE